VENIGWEGRQEENEHGSIFCGGGMGWGSFVCWTASSSHLCSAASQTTFPFALDGGGPVMLLDRLGIVCLAIHS
jgi:hypothetical protein